MSAAPPAARWRAGPRSPGVARRVLLTLTVTRWFPVGLVVGIMTLWPLERGLTVAETLAAMSLAGFTVFALELPTSGFADTFGRRPVYLAAAVVGVVAIVVFFTASAWWQFALAAVLTGVFRALDSGPLEAWFVDTVHESDPQAEISGALAAQSTVLGAAIAAGAALSGGLVWWHPVRGQSALLLPGLVAIGLTVVHVLAVLLLLREHHPSRATGTVVRALESARRAPAVVRSGLELLRSSRVLAGLMLVEVFWSAGMVVFETLNPIRLAELVGGPARAGTILGPVSSLGWGVFALGSTLAGVSSRRIGVVPTAVLARVLNGAGALVMGLVTGPVALVGAYLVTYSLHGAAGPMHNALLHREATAANRATVLSLNSMVAFLSFSGTAVLAGLLAEHLSVQAAMVVLGGISAVGAVFYLPAWRQGRRVAEHAARSDPPTNG